MDHMLTDARFHRRSNSQGLMNPREVVVHVEQGDHCDMVLNLLTEGIRKPGKAPHIHSHVEVLSLNVAGRNVRLIGRPHDLNAFGSLTLRRAVALCPFGIVTINLHKLRIVDLATEGIGDRRQVHFVAVRSQLNAIRQALLNVLKELSRTPRVPNANHPTDNELGLSLNRGERPNVSAYALFQLLDRDLLLLATHEDPNLIDLYALRGNVADNRVLVL